MEEMHVNINHLQANLNLHSLNVDTHSLELKFFGRTSELDRQVC